MHNIAESQKKGIRPYFTMFVSADDMNSSMNIVQTYQGGIGMGQRDYYLENDEQTKNIRNKYQEHIAKMFQLAGYDEATAQKAVKAVMNIELAWRKRLVHKWNCVILMLIITRWIGRR